MYTVPTAVCGGQHAVLHHGGAVDRPRCSLLAPPSRRRGGAVRSRVSDVRVSSVARGRAAVMATAINVSTVHARVASEGVVDGVWTFLQRSQVLPALLFVSHGLHERPSFCSVAMSYRMPPCTLVELVRIRLSRYNRRIGCCRRPPVSYPRSRSSA